MEMVSLKEKRSYFNMDNTNDTVYQKRIESATSALNRCKTSSCEWGIMYWKSVINKLEYPESPRVNTYK